MCCAAVNCKIVCKICSTVVKKVIKLFIVDSFFSRAANFCWNEVVRALLGRRQRFVEWRVPGGAEARDSVPHSKPVFCPALRRLARRLSQQSHHQRRNDAAVGCRPRWNREFFCQSQQLTFLSLISDAKFTPSDSTGRNCFTWRRVGVGGVTWTITPGLIYKISYDNLKIMPTLRNTGRSKMRDLKMRDMNLRHQLARVENARHENAGPNCRGGKCGKS